MSRHDALEVHVEIGGATVLAGRAQFHRNRGSLSATTFQYDPDYLADARSYDIDPSLPLVSGSQYVEGLPGAFSDSAPDRWGRNLVKKQERERARRDDRAPRALDDVDFLVGVGDVTRQGALRFRREATTAFLDPDHTVPRLVRLPELLHAADSAAGDGDDFAAVKMLLAAGTGSLGGARPKASVLGDDGRQLIAKFPHHADAWDVMAWEATALDLAEASGVVVASHALTQADGRHLLLLDRFDRVADATAGRADRVGYVSAMTLLGRRDGETADYVDIAEMITEVSTRVDDDLLQLFRRAAVGVGLNNTDDHLRNHGFLRHRAGWVLSPAFDVNPNPDPGVRQTSLAGADGVRDGAAALALLGESCRLTGADVRSELRTTVDALGRWRDVARRNGVRAAETARFADTFEAGLGALRDAVG
jgi:serine/threonine-protein kinase HipA